MRGITDAAASAVKPGDGWKLIGSKAPVAAMLKTGIPVLVIAAVLSGCAVGKISSPFRSKGPDPSVASNEERLAENSPAGEEDLTYSAGNCPQFVAWPRDRLLTIYEVGQVGDNTAIKHRGEITKTARECNVGGDRVTVKYGVTGRILLGPRGQAGSVSLPLRIQLTDGARKVVASDTMRVSASVAVDNPSGTFSIVREVSFRVAPGSRPGDYKLFVAFLRDAPGAG